MVDAELAPTLEDDMLRLARQKVYAADVIALKKIDLVDEDGLRRVIKWLQHYAPHAPDSNCWIGWIVE